MQNIAELRKEVSTPVNEGRSRAAGRNSSYYGYGQKVDAGKPATDPTIVAKCRVAGAKAARALAEGNNRVCNDEMRAIDGWIYCNLDTGNLVLATPDMLTAEAKKKLGIRAEKQ